MASARDRPNDDGDSPALSGQAEHEAGERTSGETFPPAEAHSGEVDARTMAAWRSWLGALASDPEAVMAAALAYEALPAGARDAWLEALENDAPDVRVPRVALYAPLLGVEADETRRARIQLAIERSGGPGAAARRALRAALPDGDVVCVIVTTLYLDFVDLLVCRYGESGVRSARRVPLSHRRNEASVAEASGVELEDVPLAVVVEELAHAVVADRRAGREPNEALRRYSDLFAPLVGAPDP